MMIGAIIGTIAIVLVTIAIGLLIDRKAPILGRPGQPGSDAEQKKKTTHAAGEAPATALRIGETQLDKLRASQRCPSCRSTMASAPDDHVRFGDADLLVCHFTCEKCSGTRTIYVNTR
jgi:hypothetical protein